MVYVLDYELVPEYGTLCRRPLYEGTNLNVLDMCSVYELSHIWNTDKLQYMNGQSGTAKPNR